MPVEYIDNNETKFPSRSSRNVKLYKEVYGKYENLDNLPLEDNTDEIDMERLRELIYKSENIDEHRSIRENLDIIDIKKRNINKDRIYDINEMLEKAKYENNKLKTPVSNIKHNNLLSTLQLEPIETEKITYKECSDISNIVPNGDEKVEDNIYMTREFKFKELNQKISELNSNPLLDNVMDDNSLSLDLFEDLKPTGNTIVTKPIVESKYDGDMHSSDTSDIDIIKQVNETKEEEFFTNSYSFSDKDFNLKDTDDFFEEEKPFGNVLKIILLLIAIMVFSFVIVYFVLNYGIGV